MTDVRMVPADVPQPAVASPFPVLDFAELRVHLTAQGVVDIVHAESGKSLIRLDATDACSLIGAVAAAVGADRSGLKRVDPAQVAEAAVEATS